MLKVVQLYIKTLFARIVLIGDPNVEISDRCSYFLNSVIKLAPIAYFLSIIQWWFSENKQFGEFMCIMLILNMCVGVVYHLKSNTFCFKDFLWKNIGMALIVVCGYTTLEMLRYTAGDNFAGEAFKILIQLTTLLYPGSKILKNLFILSNGKFPPEFIMTRLYDFEKNGDLGEFFKTKKEE